MTDILLGYFLWVNISENLVKPKINAKKELYLTIILNSFQGHNPLRSIYLLLSFQGIKSIKWYLTYMDWSIKYNKLEIQTDLHFLNIYKIPQSPL